MNKQSPSLFLLFLFLLLFCCVILTNLHLKKGKSYFFLMSSKWETQVMVSQEKWWSYLTANDFSFAFKDLSLLCLQVLILAKDYFHLPHCLLKRSEIMWLMKQFLFSFSKVGLLSWKSDEKMKLEGLSFTLNLHLTSWLLREGRQGENVCNQTGFV